jgi:hypothetical protein
LLLLFSGSRFGVRGDEPLPLMPGPIPAMR